MPDLDQFERKIHGKGWLRVYRLACSGAPVCEIAHAAIRAACAAIRSEPCEAVREVYSALRRRVPCVGGIATRAASPGPVDVEVEAIVAGRGEQELGRVSGDAALRVRERFTDWPAVGDGELSEAFAVELVFGLAVRRCLSCSRLGVAAQRGRSLEDQLGWESELRGALAQQCGPLASEIRSGAPIRAPRRGVTHAAMTLERLRRPLELPPGA